MVYFMDHSVVATTCSRDASSPPRLLPKADRTRDDFTGWQTFLGQHFRFDADKIVGMLCYGLSACLVAVQQNFRYAFTISLFSCYNSTEQFQQLFWH